MVRRKGWLVLSLTLAAAYLAYVIWSKFAGLLGPPPIRLGDIGEFLLFFASVVAFTMQVFVEDGERSTVGGERENDA